MDFKFKGRPLTQEESKTFIALNPGKIIMLLWLAHQYHKKVHHRNITLLGIDEWVDIFPFGVPTEKEMERMWESQKAPGAPSGNLLDDIKTWNPDPI